MTQEEVAAKAALSVRMLSAIETGNANPSWATVSDIAGALGVTVAALAMEAEK
jgi:transcriptional regulator with XRE-family HTH domain